MTDHEGRSERHVERCLAIWGLAESLGWKIETRFEQDDLGKPRWELYVQRPGAEPRGPVRCHAPGENDEMNIVFAAEMVRGYDALRLPLLEAMGVRDHGDMLDYIATQGMRPIYGIPTRIYRFNGG